mmetsp:Transcript_151746/g.467786  ORF Transcript_151746/g.467786 Transcript_151746/m.467786 type:complete len:205 (-) Transcript_151746:270-884(-)
MCTLRTSQVEEPSKLPLAMTPSQSSTRFSELRRIPGGRRPARRLEPPRKTTNRLPTPMSSPSVLVRSSSLRTSAASPRADASASASARASASPKPPGAALWRLLKPRTNSSLGLSKRKAFMSSSVAATVSRVVYPRCWKRTSARSMVLAPGGPKLQILRWKKRAPSLLSCSAMGEKWFTFHGIMRSSKRLCDSGATPAAAAALR